MRQHPHRRIRVAGVPAGVLSVVVELVFHVPAEHHVAEGKAAVEGREEFAAAEVFAAHHAVVIEHPNLDMAEAALFDNTLGILNGFHVSRIEHKSNCLLLLWPTSGVSPAGNNSVSSAAPQPLHNAH